MAQDSQIAARQMIVDLAHSADKPLKVINTPVKLSRTPGLVDRPSPDLGEHTEEVLSTLLGLTQEQILKLRQSGVI